MKKRVELNSNGKGAVFSDYRIQKAYEKLKDVVDKKNIDVAKIFDF